MKRVDSGASGPIAAPPIVHEVLRSPGHPLDQGTRSFFESRLGRDFSQVRVHTDATAARSAREVDALAFTVGRDIVFGSGQFKAGAPAGDRLLAHELAHVIQQDGAKVHRTLQRKTKGGAQTGDRPSPEQAKRIKAQRFSRGRINCLRSCPHRNGQF